MQSTLGPKERFSYCCGQIIAEATATAYRGATNEVQQKLRRVIEVWRARQIFEPPIQEAIESRIDGKLSLCISEGFTLTYAELDKSRSSGKKPMLGGSLFSSSSGQAAPAELKPLVPLQIAVSKAVVTSSGAVSTANLEYDKLTDSSSAVPPPPVHAARLSALLKALANAEGAVSESIKARSALIEGLEKLLETNRTALAGEELQQLEIVSRKTAIEAKKREVEDGIMRGLSADSSPNVHGNGSPGVGVSGTSNALVAANDSAEPDRPQVEELTPPPVESLTPISSLLPESIPTGSTTTITGADPEYEQQPVHDDPARAVQPPLVPATAGFDLLSSLSMPHARPQSGSPVNGVSAKRRRLDQGDEFAGFGSGDAMADLDDDVAELLRRESGSV